MQPSTINPFYITGGTLPTDAPSYVTRRADADLLDALRRGEYCYILNSRQMGKSSLMVRTAARLREEGHAVAVLDLQAIGQNVDAEQWYDGLLVSLGNQLRLEDELDDFWLDHPKLGPLQRFMAAIEQVVLNLTHKESMSQRVNESTEKTLTHEPIDPLTSRLVIFVEEIDYVRSLRFSTDEFFGAIRECYNRRARDEEFKRLTFCLLGAATPAELIQDTRVSPFNIGRRIELRDFTEEEAAPLAEGLVNESMSDSQSPRQRVNGQALSQRILYWTNGHPYLTQRLCRAIAEANQNTQHAIRNTHDVDQLCGELFLSHRARETDDNLALVRNRLLRSEVDLAGLLDLFNQVRKGKKVSDDEANALTSVLKLSGAAQSVNGHLRIRNRIYHHVFDNEWVTANMPDAELRRQKAAFRRWWQ
jgi:hypothetical protein